MSVEKVITVPEVQTTQITDETVEQAKKLIGIILRRDVHWPALYEPISMQDIRRWALFSVGDDNPLWTDQEYAKRTHWGSVIAPPTFLYTIDTCIVAPGLAGIQWIHGGNEWELFRPVRVGDTITATAKLIDVQEKTGTHVARFIIQTGLVTFKNQRDEVVATSKCDILRIPRARTGQGLRNLNTSEERPKYSNQEIEEIAQAYETEKRRGAEPRYWEDVQEGDAVDPIVKGPLTLVDIVAFYAGRRHVYNPLKQAFAERRRHPGNVYVSPATGIPVHPAAGHFDTEIATEIGMPRAYDQGFMRINWVGHLVTNWCGDEGFVRRLNVRNKFPNFVGDASWCKGVVTGKRVENGEYLVDLKLSVENYFSAKVISEGTATVRLPARAQI